MSGLKRARLWIERLGQSVWGADLALLAACLLAFGLLIPWLGYYQDDWYQVWFGRAFGPGVFAEYYAGERPFIAWLYILTTPLVGSAPLSWHIFALLARWAAGLAVAWLVRLLFPGHRRLAFVVGLMYVLYPGFRQQYAAVIYSHYFVQFTLQVFSLCLMVAALRRPRLRWNMVVSWVIGLVGMFTSEYFFGLELLRPLLIWLVLGQQMGGVEQPLGSGLRLRRLVTAYLPFALIPLLFLYWRMFVYQFPTYQPLYLQEGLAGAAGLWQLAATLARTIAEDVLELGVTAWLLPLRVLSNALSLQPAALAALLLSVLAAGAFWVADAWLAFRPPPAARPHALAVPATSASAAPPDPAASAGRALPGWLALMGLLGMLSAGWPFWIVGLPVDTRLASGSRFAISFMPFASLLLAALWQWLSPRRRTARALLALLAGLAVGHHFLDADYYKEVHKSQGDFFQQLAWRAPGLQPGTLVLTNTFQGAILMGDNSLTAALNWIYDPQPPYRLDYMLFYLPERLASGHLPALQPGLPVVKTFRTTQYTGNTDHALVIYYDGPPRCLRVLDPAVDLELPRPLNMPREMRDAIPLSNLAQIQAGLVQPVELPAYLFKYRPSQSSWCYYYESAELARQRQDWTALAALADLALDGDPRLASSYEFLPFIEGYARSGMLEQARALTLRLQEARPEGRATTRDILCAAWSRLGEQGGDPAWVGISHQVRIELGCP